jgi:hypothetical protein
MTNKKISRTTKGRKRPTEKATRPTVRRIEKPSKSPARHGVAMKNPGQSPAPHGGAPVAETPLPEGLVERAAERAGVSIPPPLSPEAIAEGETRDRMAETFAPRLRRACDLLAERVAVAADNHDYYVMHELASVLSELWHIRWELGVLPPRAEETSIAAGDKCEQAAGGAA